VVAAAMVTALTRTTCARIWSAFHSPGGGVMSLSAVAAASAALGYLDVPTGADLDWKRELVKAIYEGLHEAWPFPHLEAVVADADMTLTNVVRLNIYTTGVDSLLEHFTTTIGQAISARP
jgi:hypothetical protein